MSRLNSRVRTRKEREPFALDKLLSQLEERNDTETTRKALQLKHESEIQYLKRKLIDQEATISTSKVPFDEQERKEYLERAILAEDSLIESEINSLGKIEQLEKLMIVRENEYKVNIAAEVEKTLLFMKSKEREGGDVEKINKSLAAVVLELAECRAMLLKKESIIADSKLKYQNEIKTLTNNHNESTKKLELDFEKSKKDLIIAKLDAEKGLQLLSESEIKLANIIEDSKNDKNKTKLEIFESRELQAITSDNLARIQKWLAESREDCDKYRKLVNDRDSEIISLNRDIRKQKMDIEEIVASDAGSAARRIIDSKNTEIEKIKCNFSASRSKTIELEKQIGYLKTVAETAIFEMNRNNELQDDQDKAGEVMRLQGLYLGLKTNYAQLMENLDDCEHACDVMKLEILMLKGESS
jgi:hypothetical protein